MTRSAEGVRQLSVLDRGVGALVAWFLGWFGVGGSLLDRGVATVYPPLARRGLLVIGVVSAAWVVVATVARGRRRVIVGALVVSAVGATWGTASNVGRAPSIAALSGVAVATAALLGPWWTADQARSRCSVAWLAIPPLVVAQFMWLREWGQDSSSLPGLVFTMTSLGLALGLVELHRRIPESTERVVAPVGRTKRLFAASARQAWGRLRRHLEQGRQLRGDQHGLGSWLLGLVVSALWLPASWNLSSRGDRFTVLGINDYPLHISVTSDLSLFPLRIESPHLLLHAVGRAVLPLVGRQWAPMVAVHLGLVVAVVAVTRVFTMSTDEFPPLPLGVASPLAALWFFIETPLLVALATGLVPDTTPIATVHWWGNPTWMVALPFAVLALPAIERAFQAVGTEQTELSRRAGIAGAVLAVGALAKPGLAVCLIPVMIPYCVVVEGLRGRDLLRLAGPVCGPSLLVLCWQMWFLATSDASRFSSGWTFDPIVEPVFGWGRFGLAVVAPLVPAVLVTVATRGRWLRDRPVRLMIWSLGAALVLMFTVSETGARAGHGNFAVSAQSCGLLLGILAVRGLAVVARERLQQVVWARKVVVLVGSLFLASGLASWLIATDTVHFQLRWEALLS